MVVTGSNTRVPTEIPCAICLGDTSQSADSELISLECGHVFGRLCFAQVEEYDNPRCLRCRQSFLSSDGSPDDSFIAALGNELRMSLSEEKLYVLLRFAVGFLCEPSLNNLALINAVAIGLFVLSCLSGIDSFENLLPLPASTRRGLRKLSTYSVFCCSNFSAGFICSKLFNDPLKSFRLLLRASQR